MSEATVPIVLDKGLDTITHPVQSESGSLIDCLNYEMVGKSGYSRIDGFERYDGWFNGDIADYYIVTLTINDGAIEALFTAGTTIWSGTLVVGVVVSYDSALDTLYYIPANNEAPILKSGSSIDVTSGLARATTSGTALKASATVSPDFFLNNIRSYSSTLRNLVAAQGTPVAGLHWFRNTLVAALDCPVMTYTDTDATSKASVQVGSIIGYLTTKYRVVNRSLNVNAMTLHLEPIGTQTNNASVRVYAEDQATILSTTMATSIAVATTNSDYAYLVALYNPQTAEARGTKTLLRSVMLGFSNGNASAESNFVVGSTTTVGTGGGTNYITGQIAHVELTSGTYGAGTAAGFIELVLDGINLSSTSDRGYISTTDDLMIAGITKLADISSVTWSSIAGTNLLRKNFSHYQWITANFYGQQDTIEMYGATGASRGFWAQAYTNPLTNPAPSGATLVATLQYSWGNIHTDHVATFRDIPKYVAFHSHSLAFGIYGSVVRSVGGEPRNFMGSAGATETATGDVITGLLEAQNDTLIVLGKRAIRRLTGATAATLSLKVVASGSGAFDYTGIIVGSQPVYTGPSGITTLMQSETYGDFHGERLTGSVTNTIVPKLITDWSDTEPGGAVMAIPVRRKNQYRLWLSTGEVYTVTFTMDGPKVMKSNYGLTGDCRVPFAWTSEVSDSGKERIMISWDDELARTNVSVTGTVGTIPNSKQIYELDRGWGFDGATFRHFFDIAHMFGNSAAIQIDQIRLHGWSYGLATLDIKSAAVEDDYDQDWHNTVQDISLPKQVVVFSPTIRHATSVVDQANWGLGIKLRINGTKAENLTTTEPSHICQVLVLQVNLEGARDN